MKRLISQENLVEFFSSRHDQIEGRISGLEDMVDIFEHAAEDRGKN
jgi:hypothetical protein